MTTRHVSRVTPVAPEFVDEFGSSLDNLPRQAGAQRRPTFSAEAARGWPIRQMWTVTVQFVARNESGVIDLGLTLPTGTTVTNAERVLAHSEGSEIVYTVRLIGVTDDESARDLGKIEGD